MTIEELTFEAFKQGREQGAAEIERLRSVLECIAKNTCCDTCQEAALVAKEALTGPILILIQHPRRPTAQGGEPVTYSLTRTGDGAGDSGNMSMAYSYSENELIVEQNAKPRVGAVIRVGSLASRSFSADWWQTTPVTEILEEHTDDEGNQVVRFKTQNSEYVWKEF